MIRIPEEPRYRLKANRLEAVEMEYVEQDRGGQGEDGRDSLPESFAQGVLRMASGLAEREAGNQDGPAAQPFDVATLPPRQAEHLMQREPVYSLAKVQVYESLAGAVEQAAASASPWQARQAYAQASVGLFQDLETHFKDDPVLAGAVGSFARDAAQLGGERVETIAQAKTRQMGHQALDREHQALMRLIPAAETEQEFGRMVAEGRQAIQRKVACGLLDKDLASGMDQDFAAGAWNLWSTARDQRQVNQALARVGSMFQEPEQASAFLATDQARAELGIDESQSKRVGQGFAALAMNRKRAEQAQRSLARAEFGKQALKGLSEHAFTPMLADQHAHILEPAEVDALKRIPTLPPEALTGPGATDPAAYVDTRLGIETGTFTDPIQVLARVGSGLGLDHAPGLVERIGVTAKRTGGSSPLAEAAKAFQRQAHDPAQVQDFILDLDAERTAREQDKGKPLTPLEERRAYVDVAQARQENEGNRTADVRYDRDGDPNDPSKSRTLEYDYERDGYPGDPSRNMPLNNETDTSSDSSDREPSDSSDSSNTPDTDGGNQDNGPPSTDDGGQDSHPKPTNIPIPGGGNLSIPGEPGKPVTVTGKDGSTKEIYPDPKTGIYDVPVPNGPTVTSDQDGLRHLTPGELRNPSIGVDVMRGVTKLIGKQPDGNGPPDPINPGIGGVANRRRW